MLEAEVRKHTANKTQDSMNSSGFQHSHRESNRKGKKFSKPMGGYSDLDGAW